MSAQRPRNTGWIVVWAIWAILGSGLLFPTFAAAEGTGDDSAQAIAGGDATSDAEAQSTSETDEAGELSLEERVDILTEEVSRLREEMNIPETDKQLQSYYGLGPAASKVYGVSQGISLGGYGEFYFASPINNTDETGAVRVTDFYRFIAYFGYKFNDWIVMNTEIEWEHATTSSNFEGKAGSISVEFSYLDFLISQSFNVRGGNVLVPMGFLNLIHEPPYYWGNFRPETERRIIPSTWRELGAGAHGAFAQGKLRYSAYLLNGLNASKFDDKGIRGGRQKGNRAIWEDVGGVVALDYEHRAIRAGGSFYSGGADQGLVVTPSGTVVQVSNTIAEGHAQFRHKGFQARALYAFGGIDGADSLSAAIYPPDASDPPSKQIPDSQFGWYVEAGYDFAPLLFDSASFTLTPWVRYEHLNLQSTVPGYAGLPANPTLDTKLLTIGLESKPHPQVVVKLDWVHPTNAAGSITSDEVRLGAGFIY